MALSFGDAIKAGQNFDFGAYKEPAGFDVDFFSPDQTSSINWSDIYANPDVLKGLGDSYEDPFSKGIDFLKNFTSDDEKSQFLKTQKAALGLPTDETSMAAYNIPGTNVTLTQAGMSTGGFLGGPLPAAQAAQSFYGMQGMPSMGVKDVIGSGMRMAGQQLANKALYAINPVLGAVNQFYPGGIQQGFKDVTRFAGGIGKTS
jgi:hypothetical protein